MASAQKRGFHLPWAGEPRRADDVPDDRREASAGNAVAEGAEDLGRGPFDLRPRSAADEAETAEVVGETTGDEEPRNVPQDQPAAPPAPPSAAPLASDAPGVAPTAADRPTAEAAWPETDRRGPGRPLTQNAAAQDGATAPTTAGEPATARGNATAAPARRDNPLVVGLVRAMRDAARAAREEAVAGLRVEAAAREEAIREASAVATADLRKAADADLVAIREWSKAELARVREEADQRIAARRAQLVDEAEAEAEAGTARLARLAELIEAYEAETQAFFEALLAEEDPARLAGLAERMPLPPDLDGLATLPVRVSASGDHEARATDEASDAVATATLEDETAADENATDDEAAGEAVPAASDEPDRGTPDATAPTADRLDASAAAEAEAEAIAGLDRQSRLLVSGLADVADIARFKGELMRIAGVRAVSVTAGAPGDFQFTVTHDAGADLRDGLRSMTAFETRVIADDGATVSVVASEAAA